MRRAAKVFVIIGMIFGCWLIFPLIIGLCALGQINNESEKPSTAMSVVTLIFCSPLAGIFMLCMEDTVKRQTYRCEECGICNPYVNVNLYNVNTYLGCVKKNLCPQCKKKYNSNISNYNSKQCDDCYAVNNNVKEYAVKTQNKILVRHLCDKCKAKYEILEQSVKLP